MRVLLTGGTGLLGGKLLDLLTAAGHEVRCLVRMESPNITRLIARLDPGRAEILYGDAGEEGALLRSLYGMDAFVHVAGIEYTPQVISAVQKSGTGRLVMVGSTSVHSAYESRSGWRRRMEGLVRNSDLEWTIVRPTMIYGSELDKNIHKLLRFLDRSPVFPMFGPGTNLWQPVYYEDLAHAMLTVLEEPKTVHRSYDLPGARPLAYLDLVNTAAAALGKKPRMIRFPIEPARRALQAAELLRLPLPVKSEQVTRLREDKAYPYEEARRDLSYAPRTFEEGIAQEVAWLRELGLVRP